ncbi:transposase [uncultured Catenibacterium sp.]|uniref:transposase n=1 Tax=uncultured Catenibacterium sp. TaxID=286142 RepID=UPI003457A39F
MKPDHRHIFVDVPQTVATCDVAGTFKDISAIELFKAFPQLIQFCRVRYFMV